MHMRTIGTISSLIAAFTAASAFAQGTYPSGTIRIVVSTAPSGFADTFSRRMATKLSAQLKTPVIVENKAGANGNIGAEFVARSKPDGYTLLTSSVNHVLSFALGEATGYDLLNDLVPISVAVYSPTLLTVHPDVPATNVIQFIAHLKANPGKLSYGSPGIGNINHLGGLLFLQAHGLSAVHVPYKGGAPMRVDLIAGRLQFATQSVTAAAAELSSKRLRALAIAYPKRSPLLPDVPTMVESGVRDYEVGVWYGFSAPAKTPAAIVSRLNAEVGKALQEADIQAQLTNEGTEATHSTPANAMAYTRREVDRWTKVIKAADVKPEVQP